MNTHSKSNALVALVLAISVAATGCSAQWINMQLRHIPYAGQPHHTYFRPNAEIKPPLSMTNLQYGLFQRPQGTREVVGMDGPASSGMEFLDACTEYFELIPVERGEMSQMPGLRSNKGRMASAAAIHMGCPRRTQGD